MKKNELFSPLKVEMEMRATLKSVQDIVDMVWNTRTDYTDEGFKKAWAGWRKQYKVDEMVQPFLSLLEKAAAAIDPLVTYHVEQLAPRPQDADAALEAKFARLEKRVQGDYSQKTNAARKVLKDELGTPFAGLWLAEMVERGVLVGVDPELKLASPDYVHTVEAAYHAKVVMESILKPIAKVLEAALDDERVLEMKPLGSPLEFVSTTTHVVVPDFVWPLDGEGYFQPTGQSVRARAQMDYHAPDAEHPHLQMKW